MSIEVFNESGYPGVNEEMLIDVASYALARMDIHPAAEASLHIVDQATIADLHVRWMDLEGPTDVMSFPMDELTPGTPGGRPDAADPGPAMLGDIVLCPEFAKRQADAAGHDLAHELALLTVHGCLHLLGYDHATAAQEREMFALQNELLADWYDDAAARGRSYQPKPSGAKAFPSAAERAALDKEVPGGGIPALGQPEQQ
ncbi:rRNA maturation RNase YbeY [Corynebacterium uberis]|uniref:rRNA maturation RNase YbeY n=1 Tax=Corynebacterium TaxID=1716 RepID=UPI001D09D22A|nr:rRNA maturation RNase YbeY [Corynebacterium uberis]MCZ9308205.1 rRNA maturation RNase YbeY [Corynebacterium sp. c6VSa_13]UDL73886.1 rRNA maturation RNase YbeY [Corynebacterium uberis]UDL77442.1 rRNA maturation RNase YbeY [Corynebacterium uberis]UDL79728.1 rRNA maturation RNase YbeY [Corynebacterium uberis]UDL81859.1 rRNA maturation RNase YbeY [Corynebacterium uberis]